MSYYNVQVYKYCLYFSTLVLLKTFHSPLFSFCAWGVMKCCWFCILNHASVSHTQTQRRFFWRIKIYTNCCWLCPVICVTNVYYSNYNETKVTRKYWTNSDNLHNFFIFLKAACHSTGNITTVFKTHKLEQGSPGFLTCRPHTSLLYRSRTR
jgi:hypothetical protein